MTYDEEQKNAPVFFFGKVVRIYPNGACMVKLDQGKDAFFERFSVVNEQVLKKLRPGVSIRGEAENPDAEIIRLEGVEIVEYDVTTQLPPHGGIS
jgi:hypothetical protein